MGQETEYGIEYKYYWYGSVPKTGPLDKIDGIIKVEEGAIGKGSFGEEPEDWFDRFSRLDVIMQLVSTMVYVQKQKIVHGDLKPHNIMGANLEDPSRPLTIKIIDWDG